MKIKRKIKIQSIALAFLLVLLPGAFTLTAEAALSDIAGHKNEPAIQYLYDHGVISGYEDGTFKPEKTVNRAELLKILVGGTGVTPTVSQYKNCFPDVREEWFAPYVCYAKGQGWVKGYEDGNFRPAQTVNKVETIKMIDESQGYVLIGSSSSSPYADVKTDQWYADYVAMAVERKLLQEEGTLGVGADMTRANISENIYRAMLLQGDDENADLIVPEGNSSLDLITDAEAKGDINYETSLLYRLYAAYDDTNLPAKYQSDVPAFDDDELYMEIQHYYDSFSSATKAKVDPFLKRPDDPESYLNTRYSNDVAMSGEVAVNGEMFAQRPDSNIYKNFLVTNDGKAKIWYPDRSLTFKKLKGTGNLTYDSAKFLSIATKIKGMLDTSSMIKRYTTLMGRPYKSDGTLGGDSKLDIYVAPIKYLGLATLDQYPTPSSGFFRVNPALDAIGDKYIQATVAHELFHIYQYAFKQDWEKDNWWREASATWAIEFIYPYNNTEQFFLKKFIPYPEVSLNTVKPPKSHHYSAYLFALFLTNNEGDDIIKDVWENCEDFTCLDGIDLAIPGGFEKQWRKFSVWMFNKKPARFFKDKSGSFKTLTTADTAHEVPINFTSSGETMDIQTDNLKHLTNQVIKVSNDVGFDSEVKKITFKDFDKFTNSNDAAAINAVIYFTNKEPVVEEWTDKTKRSFCIDYNSPKYEDFSYIYLIFSNGDTVNNIPENEITVESSESCGGNWEGTLKITGSYNQTYSCDWGDSGKDRKDWTLVINEELAENSLSDMLDVKNINYDILSQSVTYSMTQATTEKEKSDSGYTTTTTNKSGSGSVTRLPDNEYTISTELGDVTMGRNQRFMYFAKLPETMMNAISGQDLDMPNDVYSLNLEWLGGNIYGTAYGMCDFVDYNTSYTTSYPDGETDHDMYSDLGDCNESEISYDMQDKLEEAMKEIPRPTENGNRIQGKINLSSSNVTEPDAGSTLCDNEAWTNNVTLEWDYSKG